MVKWARSQSPPILLFYPIGGFSVGDVRERARGLEQSPNKEKGGWKRGRICQALSNNNRLDESGKQKESRAFQGL